MYSAGTPAVGSILDQFGLRDGLAIVENYLIHGEAGLALEHLLYMVSEPSLELTAKSLGDIRSAADLLGMSSRIRDP